MSQHTTQRRFRTDDPSPAPPPPVVTAEPAGADDAPASVAGGLVARMRSGAAVMVVLTLLANAVMYGSNVLFSRILEPASYGDLTALLALLVVLAVPTGAAQTVIAERVAVHAAAGRLDNIRFLLRHALGHLGVVAAVIGSAYIVSIPVVYELLDLQAIGPAIALAPAVILAFLLPVALGALQGLDRFLALGVVMLALAVSRVAFGVPWAMAPGGGSGGAIAGQALAMGVVLVTTIWLLRGYMASRGSGAATSGMRRRLDVRALSATVAFVAFALLSNLDIVLAKLFLGPQEAGEYAALSTLGKAIMFLPGAVAVVLVPNAARARHTTGDAQRVLRIAALLVLVTTTLASLPAIIAPELIIDLMFGAGYEGAVDGVLPIVGAGAGLALLNLLLVYTVAIADRRWTLLLAFGVLLQVAAISAFHGSPAAIATAQVVVVAGILLLNELGFHSLIRTPRTAILASEEQAPDRR